MVGPQINHMQLHFSALLLDVRKNNECATFSLVADNHVAPKELKSTARVNRGTPRRTKSGDGSGSLRNGSRPRPTKRLPRRCLSDPPKCQILKRDPSKDPAECSRWKHDTSCGCCDTIATHIRKVRTQRPSSTIVGHKGLPPVPRRSSDDKMSSLLNEIKSVKRRSPPRRPRRKCGDANISSLLNEIKSVNREGPPKIPRRKSGEAKMSSLLNEIKSVNRGPPRIPRRSSDENICSLLKEIKSINNGPPHIPVRKSGDACAEGRESRTSPPKIPARKPDIECFE